MALGARAQIHSHLNSFCTLNSHIPSLDFAHRFRT
ncbi:hypothetical protein VPHD30_0193 [Vibrio phage D30]